MSHPAIRAVGVSKRYRKGADTHGSLIEWLRRSRRFESFWALDDVSFEVAKGEMFGIIGPNGAGKSTLLKVLSRITRPNRGHAEVRGRVGSLLEVGTGFHPELTGRENIFLNGALIGLSRPDIRKQMDEIVAFAGIDEFLDTPLKRYSSGMKVRLGFAIAVNLHQEIMLVDEVLSVGDAAFREKCLDKMEDVTGHGRTVIFVGHNLEMVSASCTRAAWLDKGRIRTIGSARDVVAAYEDASARARSPENGWIDLTRAGGAVEDDRFTLTHLELLDAGGSRVSELRTDRDAAIVVGFMSSLEEDAEGSIHVSISTLSNVTLATFVVRLGEEGDLPLTREGTLVCAIRELPLSPGRVRLGVRSFVGSRLAHAVPSAAQVRVTDEADDAADSHAVRGGPVRVAHAWAVREGAEEPS